MSRVKVTNSGIIIENYELGECEALESMYKVWNPVYHRFDYFGLLYDKDEKKLYLHGGNHLRTILYKLGEKYYDRISNHPYKELPDIKMKFGPRDEEQFKALQFTCSVEDDSFVPLKSVNLSTGVGKTYVLIGTMAYYRIKSIVITSSSTLLDQWKKSILQFTNIPENKIQKISGSDVCNMILNGSSKRFDEAYVVLASHGTLTSFLSRYGHEKLYQLFEKLGIGVKIFDEAHDHFDSMFNIDVYTNVYKTFYLTATPNRSNWRENRIYKSSFYDVPAIDLWTEEQNHVHYIAIKYNSYPTPQQISACRSVQYGLNRMNYIDYLTKKPEFYHILNIVMRHLVLPVLINKKHDKKNRVLMYIGTNEGILRVYDWIGKNYPEFIGDIGIFTSLVAPEKKRAERDKRLILTTTASAGKGEDIPGLKLTIVVAEPFKSEVIARQTLGRNRDPDTYYVELVDLGFKYTKRFYESKLPVFNKYALDVSDDHYDHYRLINTSESIDLEREYKIALSPIRFQDDRFDWDAVLPKKKDSNPAESNVYKPIRFINMPTKGDENSLI